MGISVHKFIDSKLVTVKEVESTFKLVKELSVDMSLHKGGCINCSNKGNQYNIPSEPWTGVYQCIACSSLILTIYSDRMGGCHQDSVYIYKQKEDVESKVD